MASQWLEKAKRQAQAKKAASAGKPKKSLKQIFLGIVKYFREIKSEFKKIVWPTRKDILKHTIMVIVASVFSGLIIWGIDSVLSLVVATFLGGV